MTPASCITDTDVRDDDACFADEVTFVADDTSKQVALYVDGQKVEYSFSPIQSTTFERSLFHELAETWKRETGHLSRADKIIAHPAYRRIIDMGEPAVSLILAELDRKPDYWFWALLSITNSDPIAPEIRGDVKAMASAWIEWGKANGYVQ